VAGAQSALRTEPPVQGTWTPIAERRGLARVFVFTPLADDSAAAPEPPKLGAVADSDALAGPLGEPFEESSGSVCGGEGLCIPSCHQEHLSFS
jgi:hypothetical protein